MGGNIHQLGDQGGAGGDLSRQIAHATQADNDRHQGLDEVIVVKAHIADVAQAGNGGDLRHGPDLFAQNDIAHGKSGAGQHPEGHGVAGGIDDAWNAHQGEGRGDTSHGGQADSQGAEHGGAAEIGLRGVGLFLCPDANTKGNGDHQGRKGDNDHNSALRHISGPPFLSWRGLWCKTLPSLSRTATRPEAGKSPDST